MTEPAHTSPLPVVRFQWTLLQPLLAALSEAGVPLGPGDLDRLQHAAALGPDFAQALARWVRTAHQASAAAPAPTATWPLPATTTRPEQSAPPGSPDRDAAPERPEFRGRQAS